MFVLAENADFMQRLMFGLKITLFGMIMVFAVLGLLFLVMCLMKVVFYKKPHKNLKDKKAEETVPVIQPEQTVQPVSNDGEILAAITAAVICARGGDDSFRVVSFKKKKNKKVLN